MSKSIGKRIKELRIKRGMTQKELADKCGFSESAIRNYELENRQPKELQLEIISMELGVDVSVFNDFKLESVRDILELFFRMEDDFGLEPYEENGTIVLTVDPSHPHSPKIMSALEIWNDNRQKLKSDNPDSYNDCKEKL